MSSLGLTSGVAAGKISKNAHGRSEMWARRAIVKAVERETDLLGVRLRGIRLEHGLSQEAAAELAGLHAKHVQRIENGLANPTLATVVALATAYRVTMGELFKSS